MPTGVEENKLQEIESAAASAHEVKTQRKPFGPEWGHEYWGKWQVVTYALPALGIDEGSSILDVGMGTGWTTVFLAEAGYQAVGVDIAPASVEVAAARARRVGVQAEFKAADMDTLDLGRDFDAVLVFDALHHTVRQNTVIDRIAEHLRPGGWALFGEPSWLHGISPGARRTSKELGWVERGVKVREVKRDCKAAGLGNFRRFYEGTSPYERLPRFGWELSRLIGARLSTAPQMSIWIAAQKLS